jgi:hypothetical protein
MRTLTRTQLMMLSALGLATGLIILNYGLTHLPSFTKPNPKTSAVIPPPTVAQVITELFGKPSANKFDSDAAASLWFSQMFTQQQQQFYVFFIKMPTVDLETQEIYNSHADTMMLSAVVYKKVDNQWVLDAKKLNIAEMGSWGELPEIKQTPILALSPQNTVFLVENHYDSQGYNQTVVTLLSYSQQQWQDLGSIIIAADNQGSCEDQTSAQTTLLSSCWEYRGQITLVKSTDSLQYPDLKINYRGTWIDQHGNLSPIKNALYRFNGQHYAPVNVHG